MRDRTIRSDGLAEMVDLATIHCWRKVEPIFSNTLISSFENYFLLQKLAASIILKILVIPTRFMPAQLGHQSKGDKNSVRNLLYGPRTQLGY